MLNSVLLVIKLSSVATRSPKIVTLKAVSFKWNGMVTWGYEVGGTQLEIRNPAKMLPTARRLIGFIIKGLFSLIEASVVKRGCPVIVKKIMRILYIAVRAVAIRVVVSAQAFVYDVLAVSMIRSFE